MEQEVIDPLIGTMVADRYRVVKKLGEGGMGSVYSGEHEAIEKMVALKILHPEYSAKADIVQRFQQEAKAASRIKHPNVLDIFDFGQLDNGCFFLAMEFLEGHDLADDLLKYNVLPPARGIPFALQICRALAAAHSRGVVHRDMKPENVFILRTTDGEEIVKIVDFGIAQLRSNEEAAAAAESAPKRRKLTKTGMIFGTPEYMAPEQAAGKKADLRVDIYATGVILYEMFTGHVPHTGETFMAVLAAHLNDTPPPMTSVNPELGISPEFQAVIAKSLAKKPEDRYQSMAELADAILATPDAQTVGTQAQRMGSIPDTTASQFFQQASQTNAQFAPDPHQGTHAQFPGEDAAAAPVPAAGTPPVVIGGDGSGTISNESARAQTQLEASTSTDTAAPKKSSPVALFAVIGAVVLLGGGAAAYALIGKPEPPDPEPAQTAATAEPAPTPTPTPAATPKPPPVEPAPPKKITLKIETDPPGAVLEKNGFQICDKTPCEIEANPDEGMQLLAKKGRAKGSTKVLAQKDQTVKIKLVAPRVAAPRPPPKPRLCEVEVDGIKILRPCK